MLLAGFPAGQSVLDGLGVARVGLGHQGDGPVLVLDWHTFNRAATLNLCGHVVVGLLDAVKGRACWLGGRGGFGGLGCGRRLLGQDFARVLVDRLGGGLGGFGGVNTRKGLGVAAVLRQEVAFGLLLGGQELGLFAWNGHRLAIGAGDLLVLGAVGLFLQLAGALVGVVQQRLLLLWGERNRGWRWGCRCNASIGGFCQRADFFWRWDRQGTAKRATGHAFQGCRTDHAAHGGHVLVALALQGDVAGQFLQAALGTFWHAFNQCTRGDTANHAWGCGSGSLSVAQRANGAFNAGPASDNAQQGVGRDGVGVLAQVGLGFVGQRAGFFVGLAFLEGALQHRVVDGRLTRTSTLNGASGHAQRAGDVGLSRAWDQHGRHGGRRRTGHVQQGVQWGLGKAAAVCLDFFPGRTAVLGFPDQASAVLQLGLAGVAQQALHPLVGFAQRARHRIVCTEGIGNQLHARDQAGTQGKARVTDAAPHAGLF